MLSTEESILGNREQLPDPKSQIDLLRRCLKGEMSPTYSKLEIAVGAIRIAIENAFNIIYKDGPQKGLRIYNDDDIYKMKAEADRLAELIKRKNRGENIEKEIDGPLPEEKIHQQKQETETIEDIKKKIDLLNTPEKTSNGAIKESDKIITAIERGIEYAEILLVTEPEIMIDGKKAGKQEIEKIQEMIREAELKGIDAETQKNKLSDLIRKCSKILKSIK